MTRSHSAPCARLLGNQLALQSSFSSLDYDVSKSIHKLTPVHQFYEHALTVFLTDYVLPLIIFPTLSALAFHFTLGHLLASGLGSTLKAQCPPSLANASPEHTPYRLAYTGVPVLDKRLCGLVSVFHLALTPEALPFLNYFLGTSVPLLALSALESVRKGSHASLALPVVFGLLSQVMTVGVVLPIYWLIFILTGAARRRVGGDRTRVPKARAEAAVVGLIVGAAIPSVWLVVAKDPYVTAIWQFFPLWQFLSQSANQLVRGRTTHSASGYSWIRALYAGAFLAAAGIHISSAWNTPDLASAKALFLPSLTPLTSAAPNLQVRNFLQWDAVFGFGSTLVASLWFARNSRQLAYIVLWNVLGSVVVGPGAAIAAVALWRESCLH
ncbi:hypothetical protein B0H10DRAFT_1792052 [Mycena sp. CBHHK59/15]|nr:hypothetical protein B0H10DRAFT_1792052 [Mycena sp. CBHHK59/15]